MGADVYEGDWADGKRCGEGTMQYANGDVFQAERPSIHTHTTTFTLNLKARPRGKTRAFDWFVNVGVDEVKAT